MTEGRNGRAPGFVWIGAAVTAVLVAALIGAGWWLGYQRGIEKDRDCARTVAIREDNRAMWLYLIHEVQDDPRSPAFRLELDRRLPRLSCNDGDPEPLLIGDA